ncbi:MAG: glycine cleavage system aminomethyltransferase GcvT [Opitutales bacterium]
MTEPRERSDGEKSLKKTPLFPFHQKHGARFVDFGGWEMPVQYSGILEEHRRVRESVGLFDVSHMGELTITGPDAMRFLNYLLPNDISRINDGQALYSPMCDPSGGVVDDLIVYRRGEGDFFLCVNASNTQKDFDWIQKQAESFDCEVRDVSEEYALLAIQGPKARHVLQMLTETDLAKIQPFYFVRGTVAGVDAMISCTGYTGEDGFELYVSAETGEKLAEEIMRAGEGEGILPIGLGARDSLRLEAGFPLYGHEISSSISPLQAGLGWTVKLKKEGDFIGKDVLLDEKKQGPAKRIIFFRTGTRRMVRADTPVVDGANVVGHVVSGSLSPFLNESIGSALVDQAYATSDSLAVVIRGKEIPLTRVKPPFYSSTKNLS